MTDESEASLSFVLDGKTVTAHRGDPLIKAAEEAGTFIPRFCYHPRMKPVGMCRMCLVEVKGPRGFTLQPACFIQVAPDMEVVTASEVVKKAQDGVLEYLLANHPLDCPVCDKGGECPLQDQTLAHGPGESRYVEEKRHFAKPISISDIILLDRERCIQCGRCTRFASEVVGKPLIDFAGRGDHIEVAPAPGSSFDTYFSGNIIQICPVGALTSKSYRFRARPWDLEQSESTCAGCALGCRVVVQSSQNEMTRLLGIDSDAVNHSWLCDKGRFGFEATASPNRVRAPHIRKGNNFVEVGWFEALTKVAKTLTAALENAGANAVAVLGGGTLTNEDVFAWMKLMKGYLGVDSCDVQMGNGVDPRLILQGSVATINEVVDSRTVVLIDADIEEEVPVLFLRLREAALAGRTRVVEVVDHLTSLSAVAFQTLLVGDLDFEKSLETLNLESLAGVTEPEFVGQGVVFVVGQSNVLRSQSERSRAVARLLRRYPKAKILPVFSKSNTMGAMHLGMSPGFLPGGVELDSATSQFQWPNLPKSRGMSGHEILQSAAQQDLEVLFLLGPDALSEYPDRRLVERALERSSLVVAVDSTFNEVTEFADVVLPLAAFGEYIGTFTNIEGRISPVGQKLVPLGVAQKGWEIASEIAGSLGYDLGFEKEEDIWTEIASVSPIHRGFSPKVLSKEFDGVVLPIKAVKVEISNIRLLDPMATPGIASVARHAPPVEEPSTIYEVGSLSKDGSEQLEPNVPLQIEAPKFIDELLLETSSIEAVASDGEDLSLRLSLIRRLYAKSQMVIESPTLSGLLPEPRLRISPHTASRIGISHGELALIARGEMQSGPIMTWVTDSVSDNVAVVDFVDSFDLEELGQLEVENLVKVVKA